MALKSVTVQNGDCSYWASYLSWMQNCFGIMSNVQQDCVLARGRSLQSVFFVHVAVSLFSSNRRLLTAESRFDHRAVYVGFVVNNLGLKWDFSETRYSKF
jgi:hypothetical protein